MGLLVKFIKNVGCNCDGLKHMHTCFGIHLVLHVLLSLLHCICVSSKEPGFAAASVSAVSESTNRRADMSVQYVTRRVCCSFTVCVGSGPATEEATDVTVSSAVQQMAAVKISDEQQ